MSSTSPEVAQVGQDAQPVVTWRDLSAAQWKSGLAAWLGWLFDGLDMHLYVLVAAPFVTELIHAESESDPRVGTYASCIQAAFLVGWALGGGFFGQVADRLGRSRALNLTILTYAGFTGLAYFAQSWQELMVYRFLAALGIGGEWAVGAALISETWPTRWRPWMAAILQTGVNIGIMLAGVANFCLAAYPKRTIFLVGILPALLVLWIRWAVPETEEWHAARKEAQPGDVGIASLFKGSLARTTWLCLAVCGLALTGHWAFLFWHLQQLRNLPELTSWTVEQKSRLVSEAVWVVMAASIAGNFLAGLIARVLSFRRAIVLLCVAYALTMTATYASPLSRTGLLYGFVAIGLCHGVFALFTMYLPPLFPTLLRTTGAGFCFNFGRIIAAAGTVIFGLMSKVGDYRMALLTAGSLFIPAALFAWFLPDLEQDRGPVKAS